MTIGIWNNYSVFSNNRLFMKEAYPIGEDLGYAFRFLKKYLESMGHEVMTLDLCENIKIDRAVFLDFPNEGRCLLDHYLKMEVPCYLFLMESEIINNNGYKKENIKYFRKIFTYVDYLASNQNWRLFRIPHSLEMDHLGFSKGFEERHKFAVMIAGNKRNKDPRELYSERVKAINWFERNHLNQFDLFGINWKGNKIKSSRILRILKNFPVALKFFEIKRPSYRGPVNSKVDILREYKYSICYENARDIPGYITEKIFDVMTTGCVPVYWGAPNVNDLIDPETFIDASKFKNYKELYDYITSIDAVRYKIYQNKIKMYLKSEKVKIFSAQKYSEIFESEIVNDHF